MNNKFDIDIKGFENALINYKKACERDWKTVIKQQARLLGQDVIKFTPPKNIGAGKKNIVRDVNKIFADLSETKWENKSLDKMWRAGNFEGIKTALNDHPNKAELPIFKYKKILKKPVTSIHKGIIRKFRGKLTKKFQSQFAISGKGKIKSYAVYASKSIGKAKAGWLAGLTKMGGKAPAFVSRHGGANGAYIDKTNDVNNPFFTFINNVKTFPKDMASNAILKRALKVRIVSLTNVTKRILRNKKL